MTKLYNRAGVSCATSGTGTLTLGAALGAVSANTCSFQTVGTAGASDGEVLSYLILDSNGAWEYGTGTYTAAGTTLSRTLGQSSTGSLLSLSGTSQVFLTARKEDIAKLLDNNTFTGSNTLAAGTTSLAPLTFQSGTSLTSATAGVLEYDGVCHYATHATSERGAINAEQWICNTSTYTLTSQTAAQALFNSPANGQVTVAGSTMYQFECVFNVAGFSASSGSFGFAIGGTATLTSQKWFAEAFKGGAAALLDVSASATTAITWSYNTTANTTIVPANTSINGICKVRGLLRVNAGGTIIPQISMGVASAAVVGINSYFRIWPVGTNTQISLGNWS